MKVIVNADDLGQNRQVNEAIFELMARGRVTSASVMANGCAVDEAATIAQKFPRCSFGVHLNASQFRPLTDEPGLVPILDRDGCFDGNRLREVEITEPLRLSLLREWTAQVTRVQTAGIRVSHFDSHHHMHTAPGVFSVFKRLQRQFGVRRARITRNIYAPDSPASRRLLLAKLLWNFMLRNYFLTKTTDGFSSLEAFIRAAPGLGGRFQSTELMVHPGARDFADETALLAGEWWRPLPFAVQLVSYHDL